MALPSKELKLDADKLSVVDWMFLDDLRQLTDEDKLAGADGLSVISGLGRLAMSAGNWTTKDLEQVKRADMPAFVDLMLSQLRDALEVAVSPPQETPSDGTEETSETESPAGSSS